MRSGTWLAMLIWMVVGCACDRRPSDSSQGSRPAPLQSLVVQRSGDLRDVLRGVPRMRLQTRPYQPPSAAQLEQAYAAFAQLARGETESAGFLFAGLGFELVELHGLTRRYYLVRELLNRPIRGWGVYVLDPSAMRPYLIEAPHPENDHLTDTQAAALMVSLGARALLVSTSYRCATASASPCSGYTRACGRKKRWTRYRVSDMAHTDRSVFQMAHVALLEAAPDALAVQLHGFARRPDRRMHLMVSDGTRRRRYRGGLSNRLVRLLRRRIRRRRAVVGCNEPRQTRGAPLCGTQNVQGRQANGSPDPCRKRARRSHDRFLHLEQSLDARSSGGKVGPAAIASALAALRPPREPLITPWARDADLDCREAQQKAGDSPSRASRRRSATRSHP